jgi:hypothetical protein
MYQKMLFAKESCRILLDWGKESSGLEKTLLWNSTFSIANKDSLEFRLDFLTLILNFLFYMSS